MAAIVLAGAAGPRARAGQSRPPVVVVARIDAVLTALARAVKAEKAARAGQASINLGQSILDLARRHRPAAAAVARREGIAG